MARHRELFTLKNLPRWRGEYFHQRNKWTFFTKPALKTKLNKLKSFVVSFIGKK